LTALLAAGPAAGQVVAPRTGGVVVVDHPPTGAGGPASDTEFIDMFGFPNWSMIADDVLLTQDATIQRVRWWGFYHLDNPPSPETIRLRFYDARPGDGLPGQVQYEASFVNPSRVATGRHIAENYQREFLFEADLQPTFTLRANTPAWLEIVQIGDISTTYRWESGSGGNRRFAFESAAFPDWRLVPNATEQAYQLVAVPEPATVTFMFFSLTVVLRRGRRRTEP
jgi:hypothetical protein